MKKAVNDRIMRFPEVQHLTGLSRSTLWRMEQEGRFPARVRVSAGIAGWWESEVIAFLDDLKAAGRAAA